MENIFIHFPFLAMSIILSLNTTRAINLNNLFEVINENVFIISVDPVNTGGHAFEFAISPTKLEDNVIRLIKENKLDLVKIKLTFSYYNVAFKKECISSALVCNGVQLKVETDIDYFYQSRTYTYEVVAN